MSSSRCFSADDDDDDDYDEQSIIDCDELFIVVIHLCFHRSVPIRTDRLNSYYKKMNDLR